MLFAILDSTDLTEIAIRFAMNLFVISILVRGIYFSFKKDQEFSFTFFLFNIIIFFVCFVMQRSEISMGFAFGLFAIFGILRYRTDTIPIKEMTYLFTAIALALINAIGPFGVETLFMNLVILLCVYFMEKLWFTNNEQYKIMQFEKINLIAEGKHEEILKDLKNRSQLNVTRFEIKSMNFLNDSADLKVYFIPK